MLRRNGGMPKVIVGVVAFFGLVYFIYLYNDLSGQLKNTQHSAERYRREQESVSAQLQDQILAKDELKQRCDHDKEQMTNRLNSQQQQYKMLKSQHEDMESEFGRLQNEKTVAEEEHKKQDEERAIEYNQFKQEKSLEITSLKDNIANLEREKGQLTQQISELKSQLQNSVKQANRDLETITALQNDVQSQKDLVQQAHARQQQLESQYQLLLQQQQQQGNRQQQQFQGNQQQQQLLQGNQQQQQVIGKQGTSFEGFGQLAGGNNLLGGNVQPVGNWQQHGNLQDSGINQQQALNHGGGFLPENMHQNIQGALQGLKKQFPNNDDTLGKIVHGLDNLHENLLQGQHGGQTAQQNTKSANQDNFNLVDDILKSVQDKHKPVDAALLEEHQKQHQVIPPGDHDSEKNPGYQRQAQKVLGQDGHGIQQQHPQQQEVHQVVKPNFDDNNHNDKDAHHGNNDDDLDTGAADGNHDNRIENQGPVNLQVQEPNLHHDVDKAKLPMKDDELRFRPHVPNPVDSQIQPQHVDDTQRQEQIDLPIKRDEIQDEEEHIAGRNAEDDDDEF